jgi:hypothetical protein
VKTSGPTHSSVIAETARGHQHHVRWLDEGDAALDELRVLGGYDADLADDAHRVGDRLRDALSGVSPALERAMGELVAHPALQALLVRYPTPTALRTVGRTRIARILQAEAPTIVEALTAAVAAALDEQTVTVAAEAAMGRVISELAADLLGLADRRARLVTEMELIFRSHPVWSASRRDSKRHRGAGRRDRSHTDP